MISTLTTIASTGRRKKTSVSFMASVVLRFQRQPGLPLPVVVNAHRRFFTKLEGAGADPHLPGGDSLCDPHEVAARRAGAPELLARNLHGFSVGGGRCPGRPRR